MSIWTDEGGNWGTEMFNNLPKVIQVVISGC